MKSLGVNRTARGLLAGVVLALHSASSFAVETGDEEAVRWLMKMADALRTENYEGTFSYIRGSIFDTVRIVHTYEDGVETERLFNLNGDVRELYRRDDEVLCFHPANETGESEVQHSVQIGPFTPALTERVLSSRHLYHLSMHGEDRIAGRPAVKVAISPGPQDRYGYRLWLDSETGLMLQSHLVENGRVKEIFQFTSLNIGESVSEDLLVSAIPGETISHKLWLDANERAEKPVWRVSWLPAGFRPVRVQGNRLHFSDGLANFSVFVENPSQAALPDLTTRVGGTVVITHTLKSSGSQITVVGEVPVQTAKRVAQSVEPVIY